LLLLLAVGATLEHAPVRAADPCVAFGWDVAHERAVFAQPTASLAAGADSASAPLLLPERLYALQLQPQARVAFVTAPGTKKAADGAYAGLASLQIKMPGTYRVAVDAPLWIDVVADGGLMSAKAFRGAPGGNAPHKIVVFDFSVARQLTLQFSGAASLSVRVSITAEPGP
jgi:hypothetical protein